MPRWNSAQKFVVKSVDDPNPDLFVFSKIIEKDGITVGSYGDKGASLLHLSTTGSSIKIMRALVELHLVDVDVIDKQGATPLHWACQKGNIEMIEYLLKINASSSVVDYNGWNALHYCVQGGHLDAIKLLIEKYGVNIESKTSEGQSVLSIACEEEEKHIIKYLCKLKANVKISLNTAVKCNQPKIVHYLTKYGNLSKEMYQQTTNPLHKSIIYNRTNITKKLLRNVPWMMNLSDASGLFPRDYISTSSHKKLISLLQEYSKPQELQSNSINNTKLNMNMLSRTKIHYAKKLLLL